MSKGFAAVLLLASVVGCEYQARGQASVPPDGGHQLGMTATYAFPVGPAGGGLSGTYPNPAVTNVAASNSFTISPSATVTTTSATPTTIYTEPAEAASTSYDYMLSVFGQNASTGDLYRADYAFDYQRIASAGPTVVGGTPGALNVRGSTTGLTYPGLTLSVSGNTLVFQVTGLASTTIVWNLQLSRSSVP